MITSKGSRLRRAADAVGVIREQIERDVRRIGPKDVEKVRKEVPGKIEKVGGKKLEKEAGWLGELIGRVRTLYTMVFDRDYSISTFTKLYAIAGLLYFLSPVDLIPDVILGVGLIDDALVLRTLWSALSKEVDRYMKHVEKRNLAIAPTSLSSSDSLSSVTTLPPAA